MDKKQNNIFTTNETSLSRPGGTSRGTPFQTCSERPNRCVLRGPSNHVWVHLSRAQRAFKTRVGPSDARELRPVGGPALILRGLLWKGMSCFFLSRSADAHQRRVHQASTKHHGQRPANLLLHFPLKTPGADPPLKTPMQRVQRCKTPKPNVWSACWQKGAHVGASVPKRRSENAWQQLELLAQLYGRSRDLA